MTTSLSGLSVLMSTILLIIALSALGLGLYRSKLKFGLDTACKFAMALAAVAASFKYVM